MLSQRLTLLHQVLSTAPDARERFQAHMRVFAALQRYLRTAPELTRRQEPLILEPLLAYLARHLQRLASPLPLIFQTETAGTLPLKQCVSFLVILNELLANAQKHGAGEVVVTTRVLTCQPGWLSSLLCVEVSDQGAGFPPDFEFGAHGKLGLEIADVLCRWDLEGELIFQNAPAGGARVQLYFPLSFPSASPAP